MLNYCVVSRYISKNFTVDVSVRNIASQIKFDVYDQSTENKLYTEYLGEIGDFKNTEVMFKEFCKKHEFKFEDFTRL